MAGQTPPTPTAPTKSLRRSDIKQLRRRLTCSAIRVWQQYTDVEKQLNTVFMDVQDIEVALSKDTKEYHVQDHSAPAAQRRYGQRQLAILAIEAKILGELATWYKSGHEQLNSMIAFAEQTIKEMA